MRIPINKLRYIRLKHEIEDTRKYGEKTCRLGREASRLSNKKIENRQSIGNLHYESKNCWDQYTIEAGSLIRTGIYTLSKLLVTRLGVG
jgi:hypothetical protein